MRNQNRKYKEKTGRVIRNSCITISTTYIYYQQNTYKFLRTSCSYSIQLSAIEVNDSNKIIGTVDLYMLIPIWYTLKYA
jgi:hypothetical protein